MAGYYGRKSGKTKQIVHSDQGLLSALMRHGIPEGKAMTIINEVQTVPERNSLHDIYKQYKVPRRATTRNVRAPRLPRPKKGSGVIASGYNLKGNYTALRPYIQFRQAFMASPENRMLTPAERKVKLHNEWFSHKGAGIIAGSFY